MSKTWKLLIALVVASGMLVACGGDDDDASGADAGADVEADVEAEIDVDADGDSSAFAFGSEDCLGASAAFLSAASGALSVFGGGGSDDELEESLAALEDFGGELPDEIQDDFEVFVDMNTEIVDAFADIGFDPSSGEAPNDEQMAALEEIGRRYEESGFQEATENIQAWFEENCGVDAG